MFETAIIRKHADGEQFVDAGTIAETLLFYQNVHILADSGVFSDLLRVVGPDNLLRLLDMNAISLSYVREMGGVYTATRNYVPIHKFVTLFASADPDKKPISDADEVDRIIDRAMGKSRASEQFKKRIHTKIEYVHLGRDPTKAGEALLQARADLKDAVYVRESIAEAVRQLAPDAALPTNFEFNLRHLDDADFITATNIDFVALNRSYHKRVPATHSTLSPAYLLGFLLHARLDLYFAAKYMAELVTTDLTSHLIDKKMGLLLTKRHATEEAIERFQRVTLDNSRTLAEAINSGERTFGEFIELLERATKFREWLGSRNPDGDLLREYLNAVTKTGFMATLQAKTIRFALTTVAGFASLPVGLAAGAGDTYLVDKLLKGWRPNQFISRLREFTGRR